MPKSRRRRPTHKTISIRERKLPGKIVGLCYPDGRIYIDPRQSPRNYHATAAHEAIHAAFPYLTEQETIRGERIIAGILWQLGYRKTAL